MRGSAGDSAESNTFTQMAMDNINVIASKESLGPLMGCPTDTHRSRDEFSQEGGEKECPGLIVQQTWYHGQVRRILATEQPKVRGLF